MDPFACDSECVCNICHDLLVENPESECPQPAKRARSSSDLGNNVANDQEPRPSTSTAAATCSASSSSTESDTPELCTTPCGHIFHKYCLLSWMKKKRECPSCRRKVTPGKLTRVFLPLTPGQCRSCKVRMQQLEEAQIDKVLAQSQAEDSAEKEQHWRDRCIELTQENEEIQEKLSEQRDTVDELEAQVMAEQIQSKLVERRMQENKMRFQEKELQLQQDVELVKAQLLVKEKAEKVLQQKCTCLETEKQELQTSLEKERKKDTPRVMAEMTPETYQDLLEAYQLAKLERDKFKSDRDYERGRADILDAKLKRVSSGTLFSSKSSLQRHTFISEHQRVTSAVTEQIINVNHNVTCCDLLNDLQVSDSEEEEENDNDHQLLPAPTTDPNELTILEIASEKKDDINVITLSSSSSELSLSSSSCSSSDTEDDDEDEDKSGESESENDHEQVD